MKQQCVSCSGPLHSSAVCFNERAEGLAIFAAIPTMTYSDSLSTWPPELIHPSHKSRCVPVLLQSQWHFRKMLFLFFLCFRMMLLPLFVHFYPASQNHKRDPTLVLTASFLISLLCANQTAGFQETLTEVEILALIVGCVCHDLDHRGTNNAFQAK